MIEHFDISVFSRIVLDESSILKSFTSKTTGQLTELFAKTPYKLLCSATIAPNDFTEIGTTFNGYAVCPKGSRYYPKGLRESGKEETHEHSFPVTKDQDFVITYGITGEQVEYYVEYVDGNGNARAEKNGPFYANKGDRVYEKKKCD